EDRSTRSWTARSSPPGPTWSTCSTYVPDGPPSSYCSWRVPPCSHRPPPCSARPWVLRSRSFPTNSPNAPCWGLPEPMRLVPLWGWRPGPSSRVRSGRPGSVVCLPGRWPVNAPVFRGPSTGYRHYAASIGGVGAYEEGTVSRVVPEGGVTHGVGTAALLIAVITVGARLAGFGRTVVFSQTVGDTCLGTAYVTANQVPAVLFEIVIGGALTAVVVPVLATAVRNGDHAQVRHTASALMTWVLLLSLPLSLLLGLVSYPTMMLMLGPVRGCDHGELLTLAARMLVVFSPQIVFYGLAAVLYGILQSHRRFLSPALAPLVSSLVVIAFYLAFVPLGAEHRQDLEQLPLTAQLVLSVATTAAAAALFVTALGPATRLNLRLRPRLFFPAGVGERVRSLAAAALLPLVAMQLCLLFSVVLANWGGGAGASVLYTYAWALFTLPYGVIAVPIATSAFTALAVTHTEQDRVGFASLVSGSARACVVATAIVGTALASAAGPVARVFAEQDPGALEWALLAYAPGVIGFGLIALLSRVLYASSHEVRAALAQTVGWLVVMGCAAVLV